MLLILVLSLLLLVPDVARIFVVLVWPLLVPKVLGSFLGPVWIDLLTVLLVVLALVGSMQVVVLMELLLLLMEGEIALDDIDSP